MTRVYAISAVALIVAMLTAIAVTIYMGQGRQTADADPFGQCRTTQIAGGAGSIGGPFELVNAAGETVTDTDVITEPALLYFGYTFCPDVCPLDTVRNAEAVDILAERGQSVTPVFISVDPGRDTPEVVEAFAANIHPDMVGLTGSPEQTHAASQAYRTYYRIHDTDDEFYLVDHSTFTYLVFPEHGFVEFFRRELSPAQMADQVACFVEAAS
ncbi:SCO family protein [Roseobacter sp. HKCCD9010]|uniref:SCO family protein n=1 Tax=Rhodobacterales TaxID=204455 RepID=UPI001492ADD1|nr:MULTISPECIES: SCO family protein [Rhodobacterales]MBF9051094.1 SCO family protein [Rhodobacterales bacterium HKCCD4356]NNV12863.1 SCO family protein [Roseobacter sp. HKCCD7357]NNV16808.1 SCO family protein [Roseobacter sp. HKCCD8768]NNV26560.1 SCO family protein [Roseobacter sp. HKCCD8192]NNV30529.1 SCO family protein [Roseobacter sp. HKCCD9061]